ncbi:MAG: hypothetical protein ACPGUV_10660, partial [Polyangiales bacterium]
MTPTPAPDDAWFRRHALRLPAQDWRAGSETLPPAGAPARYGRMVLVRSIEQAPFALLLYGPNYGGGRVLAVLAGDGHSAKLFDFERYRRAPEGPPGEARFTDQRLRWAATASCPYSRKESG